jgi:hypothetical protein
MSELPLDAAGRRRPSATLPQVFTPAARRATRDALPGRPNPRPRRSSRSCAALVTRARSPTARPGRRAVARRPAHLRGAYARRGRPGPAPRVAAGAARQARPTPRGRHRRAGRRAARTMAPDPRLAADRAAVLRRQRPHPRTLVRARRRPPAAAPRRPSRGREAVLRPAPARHAHTVGMAREGVPLIVIRRQLGHTNLGITSMYPRHRNAEIIDTVHARRAPVVPVHRTLAP